MKKVIIAALILSFLQIHAQKGLNRFLMEKPPKAGILMVKIRREPDGK